MKNDFMINVLKEILKVGFYAFVGLLGVGLIIFGCADKTAMPESLWGGITILSYAVVFCVADLIKYFVKKKYKNKE